MFPQNNPIIPTPENPQPGIVRGGDFSAPSGNWFGRLWNRIKDFIWPSGASMTRKVIVISSAVVFVIGIAIIAIFVSSISNDDRSIDPNMAHESSDSPTGQQDASDPDNDEEKKEEDSKKTTDSGSASSNGSSSSGGNSSGGSSGGGDSSSGGSGGSEGPCPAYPAMPNASCTGVPAGISLTPYSGDMYIDTDGTVIDSMHVTGCITVRANNVTIKRTKVTRSSPCVWSAAIDLGSEGQSSNTIIEDVEIDGGAPDSPNIAGIACVGVDSYTARRLHIYDCGRAFNMGDNVLIEDSYVHDMYGADESHNSGFGSNRGLNITVRHNNIICDIEAPGNISTGGGCSGALVLYSDFGPVSAVIEQNRFNTSGGYCFLGYAHTPGSSLTVRNNQFGVTFYPDCGQYGPASRISEAAPFVWENNVWYAPGQSKHGQQLPVPPNDPA